MFDSGSNMEIIQLVIGIIILISVNFLLFKFIYHRIRVSKLTNEELKFDTIRSIYKKLKKGELPNINRVKKNAYNIKKRVLIFDVLSMFNKTDLFPKELYSIEKAAESYLANWLNRKDDFDDFPDEILYESKIDLEKGDTILIFKFKNYPDSEWMVGYVGYAPSTDNPYSVPDFILSNLNTKVLSKEELEKHTHH